MSDSGKAVFLSYASQDAEAAKRICDALRAAGVEVWFDQSELVGGDAWDQKIRKQIKDCALLIPIISAATQSRTEGYFRLEWRLADQRTHLMAKGRAFLLPVVIDDTRDADAHVPDSFTEVQWTRLKGGETPPAFAQRVNKLLSGENSEDRGQRTEVRANGTSQAVPAARKRWLAPVIAGGVIALLALVIARPWVKAPPPPGSGLPPPVSDAAPAAPLSEARQLVERALGVVNASGDKTSSQLEMAAALALRAQALDPADAETWAAGARIDALVYNLRFDGSEERRQRAQQAAAKALALAPDSKAARWAQASVLTYVVNTPEILPEAERIYRELLSQSPDDVGLLGGLASVLQFEGQVEESAALFERIGSPIGAGWAYFISGRYAEAGKVADRMLAKERSYPALYLKAHVELLGFEDPEAAEKTFNEFPRKELLTENGASVALMVGLHQRDPDLIIRTMSAFPSDFLTKTGFTGPKRIWIGLAHEMAGRPEAARAEWTVALQQTTDRRKERPNDMALLLVEALLRSRLGQKEETERTLGLYKDLSGLGSRRTNLFVASILIRLGRKEEALADLTADLRAKQPGWQILHDNLRYWSDFDPLRGDSRFEKLLRDTLPKDAKPFDDPKPEAVTPVVDQKSVAVLAFANLSDDKANEYFSDGISEELLNVLAKVPQLKVAARTSSFHFKGKDTPIPEIARQLGVAYVVEGSVRKAGNKVRITAQLIKAADGFHVWSETYDRDLTDIFAVQDEIAKNILGVVKSSLIGEAELPHAITTKIEAYTLYLQGQAAFATRSDAGLHEAVRLYQAALAIDPDYVPALVGLAFARVVLPSYVSIFGPEARALFEGAKQAAQRALELDPRNAGALTVIGCVLYSWEWRWKEGEAVMLRARELAPHDALVENFFGDYLRWVGDSAQAVAAKRLAWELDPLRAGSHWDLGYTYLAAKDYDQALHWGELALKLAPHNLDPYYVIILAAAQSGRFDLMRQTIAAARQNVHENDGMRLMLEAHAAILAKDPAEVRRALAAATALVERGEASPAYLGYCHLLLGESEQALRWLQRGYDLRDIVLIWNENIDFNVIAANPKTRPILDQPGLKELYELRQRNARANAKQP